MSNQISDNTEFISEQILGDTRIAYEYKQHPNNHTYWSKVAETADGDWTVYGQSVQGDKLILHGLPNELVKKENKDNL